MLTPPRIPTLTLFGLLALLACAPVCIAQHRPAQLREFLLQYRGKEVQIIDKTGGTEQFTSGDPTKAYTLTLNEVEGDYIVVSRNTATDKRTFIYPLSIIRRVIYQYDGKPYDKILLEMY
ncbi:MAG TPA: hypothetical protein VML00_09415 [Bacteroidota bacterium]|nr:hypothetical protein [Bacteroidota bacterium]